MDKVCKNCEHYITEEINKFVKGVYTKVGYEAYGSCSMMGDANDLWRGRGVVDVITFPVDRAMGWDEDSYHAGVYVGEQFGCIHFKVKGA